jgi:hypothetical protein
LSGIPESFKAEASIWHQCFELGTCGGTHISYRSLQCDESHHDESICIIKRLVERTRQEVTWDRLFFRYSDITQYPYQIRGPQNQKRVPFRIQADFVFGYEEDDPNSNRDFKTLFESKHVNMKEKEGLTEDDVRVLLLDIEQYASKLKFNKRLGCFLTYSRDCDNKDHASGDDCGVCFGLTKMVTTCCSHHLCVKCFQKLVSIRRCPFCREDEISILTSM